MPTYPQETDRYNLQPKKFIVWLFMISSFIFFAGLTSGFIVYAGDSLAKQLSIKMPQAFLYSTILVVASSITLQWAYIQTKRLNFAKQRTGLYITLVLGLAFIGSQIYGWIVLTNLGAFFTSSNASISFVYVFTLFHVLHIIAGLILMIGAVSSSYKSVPNVLNLFRMEITIVFWHFVDILWIYLYVFLLLNQ
ncbi:MAG: cytochrome c oxidase subunit 3 [Chitinophagaceae bacterium]|nr:cytochrome c oxidase subunit 3 [Chitinophagaceae bacterium]